MRYKAGQKEETRKRILKAASGCFRTHGYAAIGVDGLAKAAGVTSGAFYGHFGSKDAAFREALIYGLDEVLENIPVFQSKNGVHWLQAFTDYYLGEDHINDRETGCAMTALSPEVARGDEELHQIYEAKMDQIAKLIANGLSGKSSDDKIERAWAMLGILIGGLTMARAMHTPAMTETVAKSIKDAAIKAAGKALATPNT